MKRSMARVSVVLLTSILVACGGGGGGGDGGGTSGGTSPSTTNGGTPPSDGNPPAAGNPSGGGAPSGGSTPPGGGGATSSAATVRFEESNAAVVRRVLAGAGYDVESTTLSRRALVMIERTAYDVVIADVKMPELSGQELYGRACQIRPEMSRRFVFITGDIDGQDTREFLDRSGCSYFMKPFNLERLTSAVDMLTGSRPPDTIG